MADEIDAGIDKQKILAEIGASAPLPGPPAPVPSAPPLQAAPARPAPEPAATALPKRPRGRLARHRRQISAIVLIFVALLWISVGLATRERAPFVLGGAILGLAILVGVGSLLREA